MKTTKIVMLTFLMSIFCVALSYAQKGEKSKVTPGERGAKRIEMMKKSLNLTDEQAAKIQELQKQMFGDMKQDRAKDEVKRGNKGEVNREEMKANREGMKAKREAYDAQLKTILTPEQYQKYQEQRKEMQKNRHEKMKKGRHGEHQKGQYKKYHPNKNTAEV